MRTASASRPRPPTLGADPTKRSLAPVHLRPVQSCSMSSMRGATAVNSPNGKQHPARDACHEPDELRRRPPSAHARLSSAIHSSRFGSPAWRAHYGSGYRDGDIIDCTRTPTRLTSACVSRSLIGECPVGQNKRRSRGLRRPVKRCQRRRSRPQIIVFASATSTAVSAIDFAAATISYVSTAAFFAACAHVLSCRRVCARCAWTMVTLLGAIDTCVFSCVRCYAASCTRRSP